VDNQNKPKLLDLVRNTEENAERSTPINREQASNSERIREQAAQRPMWNHVGGRCDHHRDTTCAVTARAV
jgi:hypothetical protein